MNTPLLPSAKMPRPWQGPISERSMVTFLDLAMTTQSPFGLAIFAPEITTSFLSEMVSAPELLSTAACAALARPAAQIEPANARILKPECPFMIASERPGCANKSWPPIRNPRLEVWFPNQRVAGIAGSPDRASLPGHDRSEEQTSELQSHFFISYSV